MKILKEDMKVVKENSDIIIEHLDNKEKTLNECNDSNDPKLKLGICAMAKKVGSKHMKSILQQLTDFDIFNIIIFDESLIKKDEVEVRKFYKENTNSYILLLI